MSDEVCAYVSAATLQMGKLGKTTESEWSWFRDLYGNEGLRLERCPILQGSAAVATASDQSYVVSKDFDRKTLGNSV